MNSGMDDESRLVNSVWGWFDNLSIDVDFDQVRRGYLIVVEPIGIDKEMGFGPRDTGGQVAVDQFTPAKIVDQPIGCRKFDSQFPLVRGNLS